MAIEADLDFATALHSLPMENGRRLRLRPLTATSNLRSGGYERGNGSRPARGFQLVVTAKFFHCETVEYCCVVDWVMATCTGPCRAAHQWQYGFREVVCSDDSRAAIPWGSVNFGRS